MIDIRIEEIEKKLCELLQADKNNWTSIYRLMEEVNTNQLWQTNYHSFTAWVRNLSQLNNIHESLLWKRKKAGAIYAEYEKRAKEQGKDVPTMERLSVSPDNFELIEKIAQSNTQVKDQLIDKLLNNEIQRKDLKNAWNTVKMEKEAHNQKATKANSYDKFKKNKEENTINENNIKAIDIILSLKYPEWLETNFTITHNSKKEKRIYKQLTEFPVYTGTTRHSRRIDLLTIENITCEHNYELNLHGIEIKVNKSDLLTDEKMGEYQDYCDYFWVAVPKDLAEYAKDIILPEWGIIAIEDKKGQIYKVAKKNKAIFKKESLTMALLKVL